MALNDNDYDCMAKAIVKEALCGGCSLNAGVIKVADARGLNPSETRRLVEKANTLAHLQLFEKRADDKYVTFEVADPSVILGALFETSMDTETGAPTAMKCAADATSLLPDERRGYPSLVKEAQVADVRIPAHDPDSPYAYVRSLKPHREKVRHQKIAEVLEDRVREQHRSLEHGIQKLAEDMRRVDAPTYRELAQGSLASAANEGTVYVLTKLSALVRDGCDPGTVKVAAYALETPWTKRVRALGGLHHELKRSVSAYKHHTAA